MLFWLAFFVILRENETKSVINYANRKNTVVLLLELKNTRHVILNDILNDIRPKGRIYTLALSSNYFEFLLILVTCMQLLCDTKIINDTIEKEE